MTIASRDGLIDAMVNNSASVIVEKLALASTVAGQYFSTWKASGVTPIGVSPSGAELCTSATQGCIPFTNPTDPAKAYLGLLSLMANNNATTVEIHDRLAHNGAFSPTVLTEQVQPLSFETTDPGSERIGNSDYRDVQWWIEILANLGTTAVDATVKVILDDDSTQTNTAFSLGATPRLGRLYPITCETPGRHIKGIHSITLSASAAGGSFCTVATRKIATVSLSLAYKAEIYDWAQLGLAQVASNSHLFFVVPCTTSNTGVISGQLKIIYG